MNKSDAGILEAASINRKRGRPRTVRFNEKMDSLVQYVAESTHPRVINNTYYLVRATQLFAKSNPFRATDGFEFLFKGASENLNAKKSVLIELGRIEYTLGEEASIDAARWFCENKPSVKSAVTTLRAWRTGKPAKQGESPVDKAYQLWATMSQSERESFLTRVFDDLDRAE